MRSRRLIFSLILLTLLATCLVAAAKLRATPKYDRIQVGVTTLGEAEAIFGKPFEGGSTLGLPYEKWNDEEGLILIKFTLRYDIANGEPVKTVWLVHEKHITRRGPLERLAWLAGWR